MWDEAEACAVFESGMAAISTTLLEFLNPGDVILHSEPLYGGTEYFFKHVLTRFGIRAIGFRAGSELSQIEKVIEEANVGDQLGVIYVETPANPTNELVDIGSCTQLAQRYSTPDRRPIVMVDNTFLAPI